MNEKRRGFSPIWEKDTPNREERLAFLKISGQALLILLCCGVFLIGGFIDPQQPIWFGIGAGGSLICGIWVLLRLQQWQKKYRR